MLIVNCPMLQDKAKAVVEGLADPKCTFVKKNGRTELQFETTDDAKAAVEAKKAMKADPSLSSLYFSVTTR